MTLYAIEYFVEWYDDDKHHEIFDYSNFSGILPLVFEDFEDATKYVDNYDVHHLGRVFPNGVFPKYDIMEEDACPKAKHWVRYVDFGYFIVWLRIHGLALYGKDQLKEVE